MFSSFLTMLHPMVLVPAIALLEGVGVPIPGSVVIAGVGLITSDTLGWLGLLPLVLLYGCAYSLGALVQYTAGRMLGARALGWLSGKQRAGLTRSIDKYGTAAVFWTRPFAIGNYVSAPVGIIGMPRLRFLAYTFAGICPGVFVTMSAGRLLGDNLAALAALPGLLSDHLIPLLTSVGAPALIYYVFSGRV